MERCCFCDSRNSKYPLRVVASHETENSKVILVPRCTVCYLYHWITEKGAYIIGMLFGLAVWGTLLFLRMRHKPDPSPGMMFLIFLAFPVSGLIGLFVGWLVRITVFNPRIWRIPPKETWKNYSTIIRMSDQGWTFELIEFQGGISP